MSVRGNWAWWDYLKHEPFEAGFLIVKTYQRLYREYSGRYGLDHDFYAIPRVDREPQQATVQYRGLDRDAMNEGGSNAVYNNNSLAEIRMEELAKLGKCCMGFTFSLEDAKDAFSYVEDQADREIIWARTVVSNDTPPSDYASIGFEPTDFWTDHFAPQCDCMLIPRWHGSDNEGTLFSGHFRKLNRYGLFVTPDDALEFLEYYLKFDWTEHWEYEVAEVFIDGSSSDIQSASRI